MYIAVAQPRPVSPGVKTSINKVVPAATEPPSTIHFPRHPRRRAEGRCCCIVLARPVFRRRGTGWAAPGVWWAAGEGVGGMPGHGEVAGRRGERGGQQARHSPAPSPTNPFHL